MQLVELVDTLDCQKVMVQMLNNHGNILLYNLITIGAANVINSDGTLISAKDNLAVNSHPYWTHIASFSSKSVPLPQPQPQAETDDEKKELDDLVGKINAHLNEDCWKFKDCVDIDNPQAASCGTGYTRVGWDRNGCGKPGVSLFLVTPARQEQVLVKAEKPYANWTLSIGPRGPANLLQNGHSSELMHLEGGRTRLQWPVPPRRGNPFHFWLRWKPYRVQ
jgi:hypothetical protein